MSRLPTLTVECLESKLLLDGGLTTFSLDFTASADVAPLVSSTDGTTQTAPLAVSYSPVSAPVSLNPAIVPDTTQSSLLAPVSSATSDPSTQTTVPSDSFVGPPAAYNGYPIWILNPNYPLGGYSPVITDNPDVMPPQAWASIA